MTNLVLNKKRFNLILFISLIFTILFILALFFSENYNRSEEIKMKNLNDHFIERDSVRVKKLFDQVLKYESEKNTFANRINIYKIISELYSLRTWQKYQYSSKVLLKKALVARDTLAIANAYRSIGNYYYNNQKLDSAIYYYSKSERNYFKISNKDGLATVLLKKGLIQFFINDYLSSDLSLSKAYSISKSLGDVNRDFAILNQRGLNAMELAEYEKSVCYFKEAYDLAKKNKIKTIENEEIICLSNIGLVYEKKKEYKKAIQYYYSSLSNQNIKKESPILYSNTIDNLAYSKLQIGDLPEAKKLFFEALSIRKQTSNSPIYLIISYIHLSEYYFKINNVLKAIEFARKALLLSEKNKIQNETLLSLRQLSLVDKENSSYYSEKYNRINDSLKIVEYKNIDRFARIQLETDEIAQEKETAIRQKWVQTVIIATVLLIVILLFIIYRQRSHQKELLLLQNQQEANAEIYRLMLHQQTQTEEARQHEKQRIALELHDNVMNKLASSRFNLFPLTQNPDQNIQQHASQQAQTLKEIEDEIRNLTHELATPQAAERNSFEDLLQAFTEEQNRKGDLQFTLHLDPSINWDTVASEVKMHLYRIVQEGVHNIRKHAEATQVSIRTTQSENTLGLELQDNGKGFDTTTAHKGIGLQNMQNRMKSVGGTVVVESVENQGTVIRLSIEKEMR